MHEAGTYEGLTESWGPGLRARLCRFWAPIPARLEKWEINTARLDQRHASSIQFSANFHSGFQLDLLGSALQVESQIKSRKHEMFTEQPSFSRKNLQESQIGLRATGQVNAKAATRTRATGSDQAAAWSMIHIYTYLRALYNSLVLLAKTSSPLFLLYA